MQSTTVVYIVLAALLAVAFAWFQYIHQKKTITKRALFFALLRFFTVFTLLLLLINPTIKSVEYYTEKPGLVIAVDNSASIKKLNQDGRARQLLAEFNKSKLSERFTITQMAFGETVSVADSLEFNQPQTNIYKALATIYKYQKGKIAPIILLTDGNQTLGPDYSLGQGQNLPVFPVVLGDTLSYNDLSVTQVNTNKYAFLKNRFPVEVFVNYKGKGTVKSKFSIISGGKTLFSENFSLSEENRSRVFNAEIEADKVGPVILTATVQPFNGERNVDNNVKAFGIEVVDQKNEIALISEILHPDLGMFKKSIEANEQRSVTIFKPTDSIDVNKFQLFILYQPTTRFKQLFKKIGSNNQNYFVVTGSKTDSRFLNDVQNNFTLDNSGEIEDVQAVYNHNFSSFQAEDINFESFPPLKSTLGEPLLSGRAESLLTQKIGSVNTSFPLLVFFDDGVKRSGALFGENSWAWRAQSFVNTNSFEAFDNFMNSVVQYLASSEKRDRLVIDYEPFYYGAGYTKVFADFFDKNYVFNPNASLEIVLQNKETKHNSTVPFLLKTNRFEVDLSFLDAGEYSFTVKENNENISKSGSFTVVNYEVEKQFFNADYEKLSQLATNTNGKVFLYNEFSKLVDILLNDKRFTPVQKQKETLKALIDWQWLLALLVLLLSFEWFLRKYNGLV